MSDDVPPPPRCQYIVESETTESQSETEMECRPFFANIASMSSDQLQQLRQIGLIPPKPLSFSRTKTEEETADKSHPSPLDEAPPEENEGDESSDRIVVLEEHTHTPGDEEDEENDGTSFDIRLLRNRHVNFLESALTPHQRLHASYVSLDASRPWMIYWTLHSLDLLKTSTGEQEEYSSLTEEYVPLFRGAITSLAVCWQEVEVDLGDFDGEDSLRKDAILSKYRNGESRKFRGGGFGGNNGQMPHAATTYAAVMALSIVLGLTANHQNQPEMRQVSQMALDMLRSKRDLLYAWILSLRQPMESQASGVGYRMHHDGEVDVRATYCVMAVAALLNLPNSPALRGQSIIWGSQHQGAQSRDDDADENDGAARYVASCQTYEGGFGGEPFSEAHGGYTYCAFASLHLLQRTDLVDMDTLQSWLLRRQMAYEGGFSGRTNKLVDGCYSFWQGGAVALLSVSSNPKSQEGWSIPLNALQDTELRFHEYMLQRYVLLCAQEMTGGLRDKPSKKRDYYHSCYNLSGLSIAQQSTSSMVFGDVDFNALGKTHPFFNIRTAHVEKVRECFSL